MCDYHFDKMSRADLIHRLTQAQTDADTAWLDLGVARYALVKIAKSVGLDEDAAPVHIADAVERIAKLSSPLTD